MSSFGCCKPAVEARLTRNEAASRLRVSRYGCEIVRVGERAVEAEEQQRGLIHLHVLCPQVMHFVNRILHIQAAAQPPTPADKLAMAHASRSGRGRPQLFELLSQPQV